MDIGGRKISTAHERMSEHVSEFYPTYLIANLGILHKDQGRTKQSQQLTNRDPPPLPLNTTSLFQNARYQNVS